jgi:hypothetical protein
MTDVDIAAAITIAATRNPRIMVGSPGNSAILEQRHDQVSDGIWRWHYKQSRWRSDLKRKTSARM